MYCLKIIVMMNSRYERQTRGRGLVGKGMKVRTWGKVPTVFTRWGPLLDLDLDHPPK